MVRPRAASTSYMVDLLIGEVGLAMELDARASVSIVSEETWKTTIHSMSLEQYGAQVANLVPLMFVKGRGPSLYG